MPTLPMLCSQRELTAILEIKWTEQEQIPIPTFNFLQAKRINFTHEVTIITDVVSLKHEEGVIKTQIAFDLMKVFHNGDYLLGVISDKGCAEYEKLDLVSSISEILIFDMRKDDIEIFEKKLL